MRVRIPPRLLSLSFASRRISSPKLAIRKNFCTGSLSGSETAGEAESSHPVAPHRIESRVARCALRCALPTDDEVSSTALPLFICASERSTLGGVFDGHHELHPPLRRIETHSRPPRHIHAAPLVHAGSSRRQAREHSNRLSSIHDARRYRRVRRGSDSVGSAADTLRSRGRATGGGALGWRLGGRIRCSQFQRNVGLRATARVAGQAKLREFVAPRDRLRQMVRARHRTTPKRKLEF